MPTRDRGPAARAGAAGPRLAGAPLRAVRRLRGRGPGGAARRVAAMAGRRCPTIPAAWLDAVATRRLIDEWRSESARRRREETAAAEEPPDPAAPVDPTTRSRCCSSAAIRRSRRRRSSRSRCAPSAASRRPRSRARSSSPRRRWRSASAAPRARSASSGIRFDPPPPGRARGPAGRRQAGDLPDLQRGLRRELGRVAAARGPDRGGDPARPAAAAPRARTTPRWPASLALMLLTDARRPARTRGGRLDRAAGRAGPRPAGTGR